MYHVFYQKFGSSIIISLCLEKHIVKLCETYLLRIKEPLNITRNHLAELQQSSKNVTQFYLSQMDKNSRSYQPGYHHHEETYIDYVSLLLPTWIGHYL